MNLRLPRLLAAALCGLACFQPASAQLTRNGFEGGTIYPFRAEVVTGNVSEVITPVGFAPRAGTKVWRGKWHEALYNGNRSTKGVECHSNGNGLLRIKSEGWYGFSLYLPTNLPPRSVSLAQIICWTGSYPDTSKTILFQLEPNRVFQVEGYSGNADAGVRTATGILSNNLELGRWHDVIVYCKFANNGTGILKVWFNGAPQSSPSYTATNINLGNGIFTSPTVMESGGYIKYGLYCGGTSSYVDNESREAFFDEIAYIVGNPSGAFDSVKPEGYGGITLLADNFDAQPTGASPANWTILNSGSTSTTVREVPSLTDKSLRCWDDNSAGLTTATRAFTAQSGAFRAGWRFMQNGAGNLHRMALRSGSTSAVELFTDNGHLTYTSASGNTIVLQAVSPNVWYDIDVSLNASTDLATISVNGSVKAANVAFRNPVSSVDQLLVGTSNASTGVHLFVDDILIER